MLDRNGFAFVIFGERCLIVKNYYAQLSNVRVLSDEDDGDEIIDILMDNIGDCNVYFHTQKGRVYKLDKEERLSECHEKQIVSEIHCYSKLKLFYDDVKSKKSTYCRYTSPIDFYRYSWHNFKKVAVVPNENSLLILKNEGELILFDGAEERTISLQNGEKIEDFALSSYYVLVQTFKRKHFKIEIDFYFKQFREQMVEMPFELDDGDSTNIVGWNSGFLLRRCKESKQVENYQKEVIFDFLFCKKEVIEERMLLSENYIGLGSTDLFVNLGFLNKISKDLGNTISDKTLLDNLDEEGFNILKQLIITICKLSQYPDLNNDEYMENRNVVIIIEKLENILNKSLIPNVITALAILGNLSDIGLSLKQYLFAMFVDALNESNACSIIEIISNWLKLYPKSKLINIMMGRCLSFVSENLSKVFFPDTKMMDQIRNVINSKKLRKSQLYNINWVELPNEKSLYLLYREYLENLDEEQQISLIINEEKTESLKVSKLSLILASPVFEQFISQNEEENLLDLFEFQKMLIENSTESFYQNVNMTDHLRFIIQICSTNPELIISMETFQVMELVPIAITAHHFQMEKLFNYSILCLMNSNASRKELELILEMINLVGFDLTKYHSCLWKFAITFSQQSLKNKGTRTSMLAKILKLKEFFVKERK